MHYIIDGYNLLFRILAIGKNLSEQRDTIIKSLNKKIQALEIEIAIVFDSGFNIDESPKTHYNHLEIQFTSQGVTADEWIINKVKRSAHPETLIVVTSDKKLALSVRHHLGKTETVEEFVTTLNQRYKNKQQSLKQEAQESEKTEKTTLKRALKQTTEPKKAQAKVTLKPDECFEFYLQEFEDNFNRLAIAKPVKKAKKQTSKEKPKFQTDMERWQEAFEKDNL